MQTKDQCDGRGQQKNGGVRKQTFEIALRNLTCPGLVQFYLIVTQNNISIDMEEQ